MAKTHPFLAQPHVEVCCAARKKYMRFRQSPSCPEDGDPLWVHHLFWHGGKGEGSKGCSKPPGDHTEVLS